MGYFDYLEETTRERRDREFFDTYARVSFWVSVGSFVGLILTALFFLVFFKLGSIIWLDAIPLLTIAASIVSICYAKKTLNIARAKGQTSTLALMSLAWSLFFALIAAIFIVANTWIYFS